MATLHLLIGPPGSGKSHWAKEAGPVVVCPDQIRAVRFGGSHDVWGDHRQFAAWRRWSFEEGTRQAEAHLKAGRDVIFDITACLRRERENVLLLLGQYAQERFAHLFRTPLEVCIGRNAARERPMLEHVLRTKFSQLWSEPPSSREGFDQVILAPVGWSWRSGQGRWEIEITPGRINVSFSPVQILEREQAENCATWMSTRVAFRELGLAWTGTRLHLAPNDQTRFGAVEIDGVGDGLSLFRTLDSLWAKLKSGTAFSGWT